MLLYGSDIEKKTNILIENYAKLLNSGVSADEILVIVQNSKLKKDWIEKTKKLLTIDAVTKFNVYSFFGLCYNFVSDYYPLIEDKIKYSLKSPLPHLCGLEASTHIFNNAIKVINFKGYNSKVNLLHQLLRRQSLITLNALNEDEIKEKSKVLNESFTTDSENAINMYKQKTLQYRAFDYLRQVNLFSYLYKTIKNPYKYLFLDDADEITPALFEYINFIKDDIKEFFIAYDKTGTTRKGYLCASENNFELITKDEPIILNLSKTPDIIFDKINNNEPISLDNIQIKDFIRADEMTDELIKDINALINSGVQYNEILILIPELDPFLKMHLKKIEAPINYITGSEKIENNKAVSAILSITKLLIENDNFKISAYKLKGLLLYALKLDFDLILKISAEYESDFNYDSIFKILEKYKDNEKIDALLKLKEEIIDAPLSEIIYKLSSLFIEKRDENKEDIRKINELLKQVIDFEEIFNNEISKQELLRQLNNTIISENPIFEDRINDNAINISTAQKAVDFKLKSKYLFLLNTTSASWVKQDIGPLYNAWVYQKNWKKKDFTIEDNIFLAKDKLARTLRKIYLFNSGNITLYSSVYDYLGGENLKGIKHLFESKKEESKPAFKITPRPDQKPVLDYNEGRFAVMAVAGAGKTTIMLALIIKLLEQGVKAENIFVLTYMDSASRTFKERIKAFFPDLAELPNISTIHGLCMRILKENNNHAHLGLDVDFEIIDEIKKIRLISEILHNENGDTQKAGAYEKAISAYKLSNNKNTASATVVFKRIYQQYQNTLKEQNLIDYDDLLVYARELLKTNSKIREYYANLAHFVIEDEAQDSSEVQQEIINILSKKSGNVIRCGDVNQAITSTFTNSDTIGFKRFIQNNPNCKMNYTARNSTGVINLANKLIKEGLKLSSASFLDIETKPVQGKNIINDASAKMVLFEKEEDERNYLKSEIKNILDNEKKATIGVLVRTNNEVESLAEYFKATINCKIKTKSDLISSNPVFKMVLGVFNFILNPLNNNSILNLLKTGIELGFYKKDYRLISYLQEIKTPFIYEKRDDSQFYFDLRYFLNLPVYSPMEASYLIGEFYFINDKKRKANIAPVASIVAKTYALEGDFETTVQRLNSIEKKSSFTTVRLFEEEDEDMVSENTISVLTLHKSKGDEFDYVFIPALTTGNLALKSDEVKLSENSKIYSRFISPNKTDDILKQEIIDENLRLIYVGITRAKNKLTLSSAKEYKIRNRIKKVEPSMFFELMEAKYD